MKFSPLSLANVNHYNAHPTLHKLAIAAVGATVVTVGAVVTKKLTKNDKPSQ